MPVIPPRPFGRTGDSVAAVWQERIDGEVTAGDWRGLLVGPDDLDRRGGDRVRRRAAILGRPFAFIVVQGVVASDLKIGWPMHGVQKLRGEKLCRYVLIETHDALEAEWIAANASVHGVVVAYEPGDLSARFRAFDAAQAAGVAIVARANAPEAAALQLATGQIAATLLSPGIDVPAAMPAEAAEALWTAYAATHTVPPKPRSGHPPEAE